MAKEMIISVNGREKKIAILEDGKITEFYIERGEENSGVVGNIYKGRVQRVLPGMQSAFVDIGLERDAFLYVSDFFDEEEEFERIVMEKTPKGDAATAEKAAAERLQQARLEREQAMESAQERAEPLVSVENETAEATETTEPKQQNEPRRDSRNQPRQPRFNRNATGEGEENLARTTERIVIPKYAKPAANQEKALDVTEPIQETTASVFEKISDNAESVDNKPLEISETKAADVQHISQTSEPEAETFTPFVIEDSNFERIVDDEAEAERRGETGETFKDARIQERITDQVRAIEFDIDEPKTFEIGSLELITETSSFQRIEDDEVSPATQITPSAKPVENAEIENLEPESKGRRRSSNRRNKKAEENAAPQTEQTSETSEASEENSDDKRKRAKSPRNKKTMSAENNPNPTENVETPNDPNPTENDETPIQNDNESAETSETSTDSDSSTNVDDLNENYKTKDSNENQNIEADTQAEVEIQTELGENSGESSPSDAMISETYENAQASVDDFGVGREEFAVRRGGRRRRRPQDTDGTTEATNNGEETSESPDEVEVVEAEPQAVAQNPRPNSNNRDNRDNRESRDNRNSQPRDSRTSRRPPTITDLLREGQEILVQIAKEPIAKKGARITSHIALPGRYLVYMPTIEHVGVSRKIESSSERTRLRGLIQRIRNEEDVPSGGFIVRTAGIGITEQNLRDDARYLVRTWLDIRKQAEKSKSPSLVHQDLDLVQRILRDQLSDDFAAIRVDTEEEYLNIVEFINRIQPKMVNRVKLHTRDESILQTYGIQDEIDKAIKPRVWLKSGGYLVINQTEALVAIDVNTGKFVGKGTNRLEDTITKTNMEAVDEIARQIRLRDLGGIIVLDLIDMEDRRNRHKVLQALQDALQDDKSPTKVLTFNDFGLVIMTRKRVKQSLERTLCSPCPYCTGAGLVKSPQTICYEILAEARTLAKQMKDGISQTTLRVNIEVAKALRTTERDVLIEIEDYLGTVDVTSNASVHQEQFDFAFI